MPEKQPDRQATADDIQFIEFHQPALKDGAYHLKVEQSLAPFPGATSTTSLEIGAGSKVFATQAGLRYDVGSQVRASSNANKANYMEGCITAYSDNALTVNVDACGGRGTLADWDIVVLADAKDLFFSVLGPRFTLSPQEVQAVFPPDGSSGDHANVLPHIVLKRSTMPWEREAISGDAATPWLALLLFDEEDHPPIRIETPKAADLIKRTGFDKLGEEIGHDADEQATVIEVPMQLLQDIAPTALELGHLTHVRQWYKGGATNGAGGTSTVAVDDELAVIVCNRLPRAGARSTVHLVSMEGRYAADGFNELGEGDIVTLVSLYSWQFTCSAEKGNFKDALEKLNRDPSVLRLPDSALPPTASGEHFDAASRFVKMGYVPLPHQLRTGDRTVSWYRGPLITHPTATPGPVDVRSVRAADALLRYHDDYGMFDVGYAAAWEIGRLLLLKSRKTAVSLFHWKREYAAKAKDQRNQHAHLPITKPNRPAPSLPQEVAAWFEDLALLKQLPFSYLVPDERMLPVESLRFFCVDPHWVEALLDGAFSVGRTSQGERDRDQTHRAENLVLSRVHAESGISGFLLRSQVVSGWPDLLVDGYRVAISHINPAPEGERLCLLRMERLSPNVLLCLFEGDLKTVDIHLRPEAIHFGVNQLDDEHPAAHYPGGYFKELRSRSGLEEVVAARIVDPGEVATLASALNAETPSSQALDVMRMHGIKLSTHPKVIRQLRDSAWRIVNEETVGECVLHWAYAVQRAGEALVVEKSLAVDVPPRSGPHLTDKDNNRVIDIAKLLACLKESLIHHFQSAPDERFTAAEFALEMAEGVPKVRFTIDGPLL